MSVIHFTYCYLFLHICFFPLDLENNENVEDVAEELIGGYLLLTEVKFTTSGTIRYNVIKILIKIIFVHVTKWSILY